jgi:DNA helicase HerA-like ATPase
LFFKEGRNYNHGGMFTVQRIGRLNKEILSNSQYIFMFKLNNKSDLEYLNAILPYDAKILSQQLKQHEFYIIDMMNSELIGKFIIKNNKLIHIS